VTRATEGLISVLSYVEQAEKLRRSAPFTVPAEFFHAFERDIGDLPGITFNQTHDGDDVWLSLPRLGPIPPPEPAASLEPWIDLSRSAEREPLLRQEIVRTSPTGETRLTLASFPGVSKLFAGYLAQQWLPWAESERPRRRAIALYNKLFALHQAMAAGGVETPLELVWGMGVAVWKPRADRSALKFPLVTQTCEVSLNEQTFELAIRPRRVDPVLELESYAELEVAGVASVQAFWSEHLRNAVNRPSPFDAASIEPALRAAVGHLDAAGRYHGQAAAGPLPEPGPHLVMTDSWVVFARRRSQHVFLEDIERLKTHLQAVIDLPPALASFVEPGADTVDEPPSVHFRGLSSSATAGDVRELFFPLAFNDEQVSIIERLETRDGVVVQGPPGTGKSHTIANVICHYLALGRRVLVTSKGESPLAVIREKIPEDIRPLTVALLSSERDGMKQFEHAVQTIAERVSSLRPSALEKEIEQHEARLSVLHATITEVDGRIAALAGRQLTAVADGDTAIPPAELARRVVAGAQEHGWLTDALDPESQATPRFTSADITSVHAARVRLGPDLAYLGAILPLRSALPTEPELLALHEDLLRAHHIEQLIAGGTLMPLIDSTPATLERAVKLRELLRRHDTLRAEIDQDPFAWADRLRVRFQAREDPVARGLVTAARSVAVEELARRTRLARPVEAPANAELAKDVTDAVGRLAAGKLGFLLPLGKQEARAILDAITVAGVKPAGAEEWQLVAEELEHRIKVRKLLATWNAMMRECSLDVVKEFGTPGFKNLAARAEHVLKVHELVTRVEAPIRTEIPAVFSGQALERYSEHDGSARRAALESLVSHLDKDQLTRASARVREVLVRLEGKSGAIVDALWSFFTTTVGRPAANADADIATVWRGLMAELERVTALEPDLATVERVAGLVETSGAARWAESLRTVPAVDGRDPWAPAGWEDAWRWRVATLRLGGLEGHDSLRQYFQRRRAAEGELVRAYRALVADRTWLAVHRNSPARVRQALQEYLNAIQAIGAGSGVRAIRHRQVARAAMERAYRAVPCWILPHWRVSETLPAEIGLFDLVVIDEASQSDLWALPSLLRGKKLLVVGDHKQVSPSAVGVAEHKIRDLAERFLKDQPHGSQMTPDRSIYDLARVVFAGTSVMLREHFRSVPAIIEYSNREFYSGAVRPLRLARASERLDPPLIDVFVQDGERNGDVNEPEARAIVGEIEAIVADPAMAGRSLGVVTLLGHDQARLIDQLIRRRISPREIVARRLLTGAPPSFQGQERSIVLLSMVLAKNDRAVGSRLEMAQRFNVAASRAADRMILFRSIEETDVGADTLNARLIRHFREPFRHEAAPAGAARELCQSDFEREIYDALCARGFRVRPQVRVGAFRIDFVVEGAQDRRLAIECDGDASQRADRWPDEMSRQRVLERAGWTFWRCFASSFWLRRESVLSDLFDTLDQLGIDPIGTAVAGDSAPTERRVVGRAAGPVTKVAAEPRASTAVAVAAPAAHPDPASPAPAVEPAAPAAPSRPAAAGRSDSPPRESPPVRAPRRSRKQR